VDGERFTCELIGGVADGERFERECPMPRIRVPETLERVSDYYRDSFEYAFDGEVVRYFHSTLCDQGALLAERLKR
jgi:hypothetical protein